jgi:hypothetical protein
MRIISILVLLGDIPKRKQVQLLMVITAGSIDWEKHTHGDQGSHKANGHSDLQKAEKEVAIERVVLQHVLIFEGDEWLDPVEKASGETRSALTMKQRPDNISTGEAYGFARRNAAN